HYQIRVDRFYVLGHQAKLANPCRIHLFVVAEGDWLKRVERLAEFVHRLDLFLETFRGGARAKYAACVNKNGTSSRRRSTENVADSARVGGIRTGSTDGNSTTSRGDINAGVTPQGDIVNTAD